MGPPPEGSGVGPVRLQRFLASCGLGSRRSCERWIREARVTVDGRPAELGMRVDPRKNEVRVDGRVVRPRRNRTIVFHKPRGVTTTRSDPHAVRCLPDLLPEAFLDLFPVGRLDRETEGLLLLTNDGALAQRLAHPSNEVPRVYRAVVEGAPDERTLEKLRRGVTDRGERLRVDGVHRISAPGADRTELELVLHRGRKREIRRMLRAVGHPVERLIRIRFGPVALGDLEPGAWRELSATERRELESLKAGSGGERRNMG